MVRVPGTTGIDNTMVRTRVPNGTRVPCMAYMVVLIAYYQYQWYHKYQVPWYIVFEIMVHVYVRVRTRVL